GGVAGRHLRGERRRLARALETARTGGGPGDHVPGDVGDGDDGVVERALDVDDPRLHVLASLLLSLALGRGGRGGACCGRRGICAFSQICFAVVRPMPYRYVSEIWICFSRGRSTPAIRAIYRLLIPAAACDGGSRSRSRARRPCGGSPCTSRRSSSPKHGPSRLPPADKNAPKIAFLPSAPPTAARAAGANPERRERR